MSVKRISIDALRLITFRITEGEMLAFDRGHLIFGLVATWLVGMGRYWDDPGANILQHLGIGSLIYIFVLAFILWIVVLPLKPKNWSYFHILTFISLVSPPAILYAVPVEQFMSIGNASQLNALFLLIVATWRVILLLFFLTRFARISPVGVLTAALLPITAIVITLTALNLERAVYDVMGGFRDPTPADRAYNMLMLISLLSILLFPITLISYIILIYLAGVREEREMITIAPDREEK